MLEIQVLISWVTAKGNSSDNSCKRAYKGSLTWGKLRQAGGDDFIVSKSSKDDARCLIARFTCLPWHQNVFIARFLCLPWHQTPEQNALNLTSKQKRVYIDSKYLAQHSQVHQPHGKDFRYLESFDGLFANYFNYIMVLCDFFGRVRSLRAINNWDIHQKHTLAVNRYKSAPICGHSLARAQLIICCFRDSV